MNSAAYINSVRDAAEQPPALSPPKAPVITPEQISCGDLTLFGLVELVLKDRPRLEVAIRQAAWQPLLIPRLLAIALLSFVMYGVAMAVVMSASGLAIELTPVEAALHSAQPLWRYTPVTGFLEAWTTGSGFALIAAYAFGLIAATGVCLPSLYFYGLLAGIKLTMVDVVTHALKGKATTAIALIGILPVYVAVSLGIIVFDFLPGGYGWMKFTLLCGLCLPFVAGVWGTVSLYHGFAALADTLPVNCRDRRACFLRRLVFSWGLCYTAVAPLMIFTVWQTLQAAW
jgi:hypothetical protein